MLIGAALIVAAIASGWLAGSAAGTTAGRVCRALAGIAGAALIAWGLVSHVGPGGLIHGVPNAAVHRGPSAAELVRNASVALQACPRATAPTVPDGATASLPDMEAADAAFHAYDAATNSYTRCVDAAVARVAKQFAGVAEAPDLEALTLYGTRAHNAAVDREQAAVDQFNGQLRVYKAKHHAS
ncbi:MAG: hypothetical protein WA747_12810 [Steroidobacteraceae bacterium]